MKIRGDVTANSLDFGDSFLAAAAEGFLGALPLGDVADRVGSFHRARIAGGF
jgi:hypothetical protein